MDMQFFIKLCEEAVARSHGRRIRLVGLSVGIDPKESTDQLQLPL